jgi:cytoskeleton protein RodZ
MAEIGAALREARMRQRIDITDMEVRTKIRAKYLRALENEEWDLLPGPTYVRSFLRTYADALGLDSKLLVEEYKLRHDPLETGELHPMRRPSGRERDRRRGGQPRGFPRGALIGVVFALIVGALYFVGREEDPASDGDETPAPMTTETDASQGSGQSAEERRREREEARRRARERAARRAIVRLQIVPTGTVSVCLANINGDILVRNEILQPGEPTRTFRSKRFRLVLGNNQATLRINGTNRTVPPSSDLIGYTITRNGRSDLPPDRRPNCAE